MNFIIFILIVTYTQGIRVGLTKTEAKKKDPDEISDKELDELLKDPKYASLAGDLFKGGAGAGAETAASGGLSSTKLTAASPSLGDLGSASLGATDLTKTPEKDLDSGTGHYMSKSYKDHLDRMGKKGKSLDSHKDNPLDNIDLLGKVGDPLDLLGGPSKKTTDIAAADTKKDKKEEKVDDKFKNFDFISKQQARLLIEILKQPVFFNMLPPEAQQIVKVKYNFIIYL
jgi:hypothetical protein